MEQLKNIKLQNFRNYSDQSFDELGQFNIFVGPNAVGKTNAIEAIELVTELSSFRHPKALDLIKQGEDWCRIEAKFEHDNCMDNATLFIDDKKTYMLNGKKTRFKGKFPSVTFTPDDLFMVKGGNSLKRDAVDALGSQLSKNYYTVRKDYSKTLRQKNKLLKENPSEATIKSINDVMVITGAQLMCYRNELVKKISPLLSDLYCQITGASEKLSIEYLPTFVISDFCGDHFSKDNFTIDQSTRYKFTRDQSTRDKYTREKSAGDPVGGRFSKDNFTRDKSAGDPVGGRFTKDNFTRDQVREAFASTINADSFLRQEIAAKKSLVGPHKDKITFTLDGKNAADFASQGQQRSIALAFKLTELQLIENMLGKEPILLLDDVMSELDANRRKMLINFVTEKTQVFVTTTTLDYFDPALLDSANIIEF